MTEGAFRELFVFPEGAHRLVVRLPAERTLEEATSQVAALAPGLQVKSWKQINPFLAQMIDAVQVQTTVVYFVMYIAVAILVLNSMLMAVFERIREFGVLKAIGYGPVRVLVMVTEGLLQALVATVLGCILALPFMYWFQTAGLDVGRLGGVSSPSSSPPTISAS